MDYTSRMQLAELEVDHTVVQVAELAQAINDHAAKLNNVVTYTAGPTGPRPAASLAGRLYIPNDSMSLGLDDGAAWRVIPVLDGGGKVPLANLGGITTAQLAAAAGIVGAQLADSTIGTAKIANASITTALLAATAQSKNELATGHALSLAIKNEDLQELGNGGSGEGIVVGDFEFPTATVIAWASTGWYDSENAPVVDASLAWIKYYASGSGVAFDYGNGSGTTLFPHSVVYALGY